MGRKSRDMSSSSSVWMKLTSAAAGRGGREDETYVKLERFPVGTAVPYFHVVLVHAVS